ncbi:MAG: L,D-transpeptidase [Deltaproteobacteria bacterium]|nr:L,D-transpeptidase [Deltaproteobacteria bacterium]MBN2670516.1 L,D-transpeptidase [Deltaproteobacteria bacterium]
MNERNVAANGKCLAAIWVSLMVSICAVALCADDTGKDDGIQPETCRNSATHEKWIQRGILHSHAGHVVLVVKKRAHVMTLYRGGSAEEQYPVEIGMENKTENGWKPTPIGVFNLEYKSYTKYYKALLFKMPGYYEIHGMGTGQGKNGQDWTWGCIALSNQDMDRLFEAIGLESDGSLVGVKKRFQLLKNARLIVVP